MKADLTRDTFDPRKHFSRVLMQQGRVQLDADWNEQSAILLHYLRTLAKDILGPHSGPASDFGFEIAFDPATGDATIGPGRYYVDGVLVENEQIANYSKQVGYPYFEPETTIGALKEWKNRLLFYLEVWERHITYVEDDYIREAALGGADTCTRAQVAWQVKVLRSENPDFICNAVDQLHALGDGRLRARARLDKPPTELCVIPPESRYRGAENQLYRVEVHKGGSASDGATFKWSRENGSVTFPIRSLSGTTVELEHLGRDLHLSLKPGDWVEVVDDAIAMSGGAGPLAQVDKVNRDELSVTLKLPSVVTSLPTSYTETSAEATHALLRRWDHAGDSSAFGGALPIVEKDDTDQGLKDGWVNLEDGVQIWFAKSGVADPNEYRAGDYWLIPARVATGDVEWPDELDGQGKPKLDSNGNPIGAALAPHGPRHYYAPLRLYQSGDALQDCRCRIKHLPCEPD
jgi:Family of unknown function (DUF6519)